MNDVIHPLKQLCKVVRWAPRSSTYKSEFYSLCADTGWIDKPSPPHLFLPFLDRTKVSSSLFSWHILRGRQWAKSTEINHFPCYFYVTYLQPEKEMSYRLEFRNRDGWVSEASLTHLDPHRSVDIASCTARNLRSRFLWTHREMRTARPRLRWRIFLCFSLAHLYPRPSTSEVPCWMTHSWLHLCFRKYWVEIALTLAAVPEWSHSGSWSIMMRRCLNYILQKIFSGFFQKNGHLTSLHLKFHLQVSIAFSPIYFFFTSWVWWMKTEGTVLMALRKWIISLMCILLLAKIFFS